MNPEEAKARLQEAGFEVASSKRLPNETGEQIRLTNRAIVNVFDSGKVSFQGSNQEEVKAALGFEDTVRETPQTYSVPGPSKVFVVYGHDQKARDQLEAMLRRWGVEPLILDQLPTEGQTIIEKLESSIAEADFGVVLATPDDQGHRADHPDELAFRARQNVVLELGMLLSRLGRRNVAILLQDQEDMEKPSDIQGLIYIPFKDDIAKEAGVNLAKAMTSAGYQIDIAKL